MKCVIFLLVVIAVAYASGESSAVKKPATTADYAQKGMHELGIHKKRDAKKVEVEEEEEEETDGSEYDEESEEKIPDFYGGIKLGLNPWKLKNEEKLHAKKTPTPPFGFGFEEEEEGEEEKKHKFDGKEGGMKYPNPKFFLPGGIYKDYPFKKSEGSKDIPFMKPEGSKNTHFMIPKDIYKKEEKDHKAPMQPGYGLEKPQDIPFYGIPFLYGDMPKFHGAKPYADDKSEEEAVDPKLLYKQYLFGLGRHLPFPGTNIPPYAFDPKMFHEFAFKDPKAKSKDLKQSSDDLTTGTDDYEVTKDVVVTSTDAKGTSSVYKAHTDAANNKKQ